MCFIGDRGPYPLGQSYSIDGYELVDGDLVPCSDLIFDHPTLKLVKRADRKEVVSPTRPTFLVKKIYCSSPGYQKRYIYFLEVPDDKLYKTLKDHVFVEFDGVDKKDESTYKRKLTNAFTRNDLETNLDHGTKNPKIRKLQVDPNNPSRTLSTNQQANAMRWAMKKKNNTVQGNHSDQVQRVLGQVFQGKNDIQRAVWGREGCVNPTVVCYEDWHLWAIHGNCSTAHENPSILTTDLTFQIGPAKLVTTVFKLKGVTWKNTNRHPVVFGPIAMVYNTKKEDYNFFYNQLALALESVSNDPDCSYVIGKYF